MKKKILGALLIEVPFLTLWYALLDKEVFIQLVIWAFLLVGCVICVKKGIDLMID